MKFVFTKINDYPSKIVNKTLREVERNMKKESLLAVRSVNGGNVSDASTDEKLSIFPYVNLPYKGKEGEGLVRDLKGYLKRCLPKNVKPRFTYKGNKLGSFFRIKDCIKIEHQSGLIYGYPKKKQLEYVGETNVRYETRTREHVLSDKKSAIYKHARLNDIGISTSDFKIIEKGYHNVVERKIAEALYIKELKPKLNEQVISYKLQLFN